MVTALGADLPPMTLLVSTDTVVTDVLARVVEKHPIPGVTADDLVLVEEEVLKSKCVPEVQSNLATFVLTSSLFVYAAPFVADGPTLQSARA